MLKRLPQYLLAAVILFASYQVRQYEGLLAAAILLFIFGMLDA